MRLFFGVLGLGTAAALAAVTVACNGLLGIQSATVGDVDAGAPIEAGVNCPYYCQTITQNCSSATDTEYQQDSTMTLCLDMCNQLELDQGTLGDTSANTLGCRIHYAQLASSDPTTNCRFAGPLGGGVCGSKTDACGNFCQLDVPYCAGLHTPSYASVDACNQSCLVTGRAGDGGTGYVFTTDGGSTGVDLPEGTDTLNCRYYHLENAWPSKARGVLHCPHTMPNSGPCQ